MSEHGESGGRGERAVEQGGRGEPAVEQGGRGERAVGPSPADIGALIERVCAERELPCETAAELSYVVTLPGQHKLKTVCNLIVGEHTVRVEAFVMRQPDENREQLWAWLLQRNARMYGMAFAIDAAGDVYLTGRLSLHAVTADELDRLLGAVVTYADESFNPMLEIGFGSAIRREWRWRVERGEPLDNLRAFEHFVRRTAGS
jgi:Putative bacterial sensory transduction regulator